MRVTRLSLTNVRGFASLELDLDRPTTVLVGVNGSGKTTVLRWIAWMLGASSNMPFAMEQRANSREGAASLQVRIQGAEHENRARWSTEDSRSFASDLRRNAPAKLVHLIALGTLRFVFRDLNPPDHGPDSPQGYGPFLAWFKDREDVENARRVAARNFDIEDPQLRAVRLAVAELMPGFTNLRIDREAAPPAMVVTKGDVTLRLDQLSDGERNLIALAGDLARRMALFDPAHERPNELDAIVLIDEVEQHLHPGLQREVIPALRRAFPNVQLVVTTHSPQVLSSVPAEAVVVLDQGRALPVTAPTGGRDANAILREVFGVPERPRREQEEVLAIRAMLDDGHLDEARARLDALAAQLSDDDDAVLTLRTALHFAEVGL